jgi:release factor glutamine methyltransferase
MTIRDLYQTYLDQLSPFYPTSEAEQIRQMAFETLAFITRSDILMHPEKTLSSEQEQRLMDALSKLCEYIPIQYVLGESWFYKLRFEVNEAVLIPRPETEELVTAAIQRVSTQHNPRVLDIGTGSGCIPIAIKKNIPAACISSIDISKEALQVAAKNALTHSTEIDFIQCDFLEDSNWNTFDQYDLIISNPPYIPKLEMHTMDKHVTAHEPHLALFVADQEPFIFYEKIALFGINHLHPSGMIMVEVHEKYANEVAAVFTQKGYFTDIQKDFFGKERMVFATLCL